jgi:hypothetical protein
MMAKFALPAFRKPEPLGEIHEIIRAKSAEPINQG